MPMTRSELAEAVGVNPETIRYYERRGLLPDPPRTSAGYRQYDASYVRRLRFIGRAKELGFTLHQIKELLALRAEEDTDCGEVRRRAREKIEDVEAKLRNLRRIRTALSNLAETCRHKAPTGDCPILDTLEGDAPSSGVR